MTMLRQGVGSPVTPSTDAPSPSDQQQATRKRKAPSSNPNSRGVSTLTPEQLAKKRQNDREAQRAIRERTKAQIETLEKRIHDLTTQQPYQELQAVIRQRDAVQAENIEIKRRLTSILHIIQPLVGAQGLTELATAAHGNATFNSSTEVQQHQFVNGPEHAQHDNRSLSHHTPATTSPQSPFVHQWQESQGTEGNKLWQSSVEALNNQRADVQRGLELSESGERLSFNFLLDGNRHPPATNNQQASPLSYPPLTSPGYAETSQAWAALPKNLPPTCPLDGILLKFLHSRQAEPSSSRSTPAYPSVSSLLNPTASATVDPLSQVMVGIISKFPGITGLPEQVAILMSMFQFMRWCVQPTPQNFDKLYWLRPTPSQLYEAHPCWIDYVPWPKIRDKLVENYRDYPFENWFSECSVCSRFAFAGHWQLTPPPPWLAPS